MTASAVLRSSLRETMESTFVELVDQTVRAVADAARTPNNLDVAEGFDNPSGETAASIQVRGIRSSASRFVAEIEATSPGAFFTNLGEVLTPTAARVMTWIDRQSGGRVFAQQVDMTRYAGWFNAQVEFSFDTAISRA